MAILARVALSLWIGAVACTGFVVAPVVFSKLETGQAGDLMAPIFRTVDLYGVAAAVLVFIAARGWRRILAAAAGAAAAVNVVVIAPRIGERDLYHHLSTLLWVAILVLGVVLLAVGVRRRA